MKLEENDGKLLLWFIAEARKRGVAHLKMEINGGLFEVVLSPEPQVELSQKEREVLLDSPDVSESRKRELQQEIDRDLYGASQ